MPSLFARSYDLPETRTTKQTFRQYLAHCAHDYLQDLGEIIFARAPSGSDEEDRVIAEAVMRGLQNPATLPDPARPADLTTAAPGLAQITHEAATGNAQTLI